MAENSTRFSSEVLKIDAPAVAVQVESTIRDIVSHQLKRKGAVVAVSGGVDSSVVAALCARALGKERVLALLMPEADSAPETLHLSRLAAESLGIRTQLEDITPILRAAGCYQRRDEAIRKVLPEYGEGYKSKIVLPDPSERSPYQIFSVVVQSPAGVVSRARLTAEAYLGILAATSFKQRTRKMLEYYWADRLTYAVAGTPNRLEYDQGFFVKNGDGAADLKPIAHLYKSQVYQLAAFLGIPEEIQRRPPTTDTYSLPQSQEEFYFSFPYEKMDLLLYGKNHGIAPGDVGKAMDLTAEQVQRVYELIAAKRRATHYLHLGPLLVEKVSEIG